ncbi:MAG: PatB family C-S lyase [Candidatus Azobacteroides sp.]|nr:PatB family C-S lyase [Candidatus Azobacteroides sp.]
MKHYNFDEVISRKGTNSLKYDMLKERFGRDDLISLWVADMDFQSPEVILDAIRERCDHGVLGYTFPGEGYYQSIIDWLKKRHDFCLEKSAIGFLPGVVSGLAFCVNCFTSPEDKIIVQPPIYPPFMSIPKHTNRMLVDNPLILQDGQYRMNFSQLEEIAKDPACKMLLLCNPHNPGGRSWSKEELAMLSEICISNNVFVVSDEIHGDLVLEGHKHVPFASVSEGARNNSITLMAPSKTFNIAGMGSCFYFAQNKEIHLTFSSFLQRNELVNGHIFAYLTSEAAFTYGEDWLDQLLVYIKNNISFVDTYLKENIPEITAIIPEASFLVWLDCRKLGLSQEKLVSLFVNDAHLALNDGISFSKEGEGFMRLNVGCAKSILEKAMQQLKEAVNKRKNES